MSNAVFTSRRHFIVLSVCVGIFALGQFHRASGSVFTPILMDRFALSAATIGGLVSVMYFATILSQMPFGIALDRYGPRPVLSACITAVAFGTVLFALGGGFEATVFARIMIGIGLAAMGAATHVIIARNFKEDDFGYVSGLVVTLGGVGGLLGTYPLALALERAAWPWVFGLISILTLLLALGVFRAIAPGAGDLSPQEGDADQIGFLGLLRQKEFVKILAMSLMTYAPITTITGLWGGPYLQDVAGLSPERAGAVLLLLFAATIVGGFVFGLLDKRAASRKRVILIAVGLSTASLAVLAALDRPNTLVGVGLLLVMVFCQQFYVPLGAHMRKSVPDRMLGRASTLQAMVAVAAIPALQILFGSILDGAARSGFMVEDQYRFAFGLMALMIALAGMIYATSRFADRGT